MGEEAAIEVISKKKNWKHRRERKGK